MTPKIPASEKEIVDYMVPHALFQGWEINQIQDLANSSEVMFLKKDELLFRQNDTGDAMYLILDGKLESYINGEGDSDLILEHLEPGEQAGALKIITHGQRTETVRAVEDCKLIKIPNKDFEKLAQANTNIMVDLTNAIKTQLRQERMYEVLRFYFGDINHESIKDIESYVEWKDLKRGEYLFYEGDTEDDLYIVAGGRLQAIKHEENSERIIGEILKGECIGEMALFRKEPRNASIRAIRNSEIIKFSSEACQVLYQKYPQAMIKIVNILIDRLKKNITSKSRNNKEIDFAVIPLSSDFPIKDFCKALVQALSRLGSVFYLNSQKLDQILGVGDISQTKESDPYSFRISTWMDEQESKYDYKIYEADCDYTPWTRRCLRHADKVILVGDGKSNPNLCETEEQISIKDKGITTASQTLVLVHPESSDLPCGTQQWLQKRKVENHFHLRWNQKKDFDRLARIITGNAIGLVLGGGGARGFAHIGVIQAMEELGVPIDLIGGTSMGAVIASQYALGWSWEKILQVNKKAFLEVKPFNEYTLPIVSLLKSKKLDHVSKEGSGNAYIEDLWINYFCISSNLSTATPVVHKNGPLWKALRATSSLPGITVPVIEGNHFLVDGGVLNNLPGDIMRQQCNTVIAVDVSEQANLITKHIEMPSPWKILWSKIIPFKQSIETPNIVEILMQAMVLGSVYKTNEVKKDADLYLLPPLEQFSMLEFKSMEKIIKEGFIYGKQEIQKWKNESKLNF